MKPKWLIEHYDDKNSTQLLIEEVERQGYELSTIKYEPFQSGRYDVFKKDDCVIVQSSINFAQQMLKENPEWIPGSWLTTKNYECQSYYAHLGSFLFNTPYVMMPRDDIIRNINKLDGWFGCKGTVFIRPNSAMKPFTAGLFDLLSMSEFMKKWQWVIEFTEPETLLVISSAKEILAEWRFIIADKKVVTGCQYECNGKFSTSPLYQEEAKQLAQSIAETYQPDPVFVVDICQGADKKYYLLELGSFNVAGLYACDMKAIVETISEIALKEWEEYHVLDNGVVLDRQIL